MNTKIDKAKKYYEKYPEKLLKDYLNGNRRVEEALKFVIHQLNVNIQNVLDIGCGIGWSSFEIASRSNAKVLAVDLSEASIVAADQIFKHPNIEYKQLDITTATFRDSITFDLIVLIDVFEHIPKESRIEFYDLLNGLLSQKGKIVLTCPTIYHQKYLKVNMPEGLQPIDEDIDLNILTEFAKVLNADISHFQYRSIWNQNDYFHATIQRNQGFNQHFDEYKSTIILENKDRRKLRLKNTNYSYLIDLKNLKRVSKLKIFERKIKSQIKKWM
jgi:cyclopropane fatty-acyl-phospholipid synthase-like methyltransferase